MYLKYLIFSLLTLTSMVNNKKSMDKGILPDSKLQHRTELAKISIPSNESGDQKMKMPLVSNAASLKVYADSLDAIEEAVSLSDEVLVASDINIQPLAEDNDCYHIFCNDTISTQIDIPLEYKIIKMENIYKQKLLLRIRYGL